MVALIFLQIVGFVFVTINVHWCIVIQRSCYSTTHEISDFDQVHALFEGAVALGLPLSANRSGGL